MQRDRVPTVPCKVDTPTNPPLSARERAALIRILGISSDEPGLEPRRKAALDAYIEVLSSPPLVPDEVLSAARALIRTWAEVGTAARPRTTRPPRAKPSLRRRSDERSPPIFATLLELDPNVTARTETMSPQAMTNVLERYGYL